MRTIFLCVPHLLCFHVSYPVLCGGFIHNYNDDQGPLHHQVSDHSRSYLRKQTNASALSPSLSALYRQALVVKTRAPSLKSLTELSNPWAEALPCTEAIRDDCTCGNWHRWADVGEMTPVACVKNTLAATYALAKKVKELGFESSLAGGTLLGAQRCGTFIPWDYDADLHVHVDSDEQKQKVLQELNQWQGGPDRPDSIWVTFTSPVVRDWLPRGESTNNGNVHVDLSVVVGEKPTVPAVLNDVIFYATSDFDAVLKKEYGDDWQSSPKRWKNWETQQLVNAPLEVDVKSVDACKSRMAEIDAALKARGTSDKAADEACNDATA